MRAERLNLSIFAPSKLCGGVDSELLQFSHYAYTFPLPATLEKTENDRPLRLRKKDEQHF